MNALAAMSRAEPGSVGAMSVTGTARIHPEHPVPHLRIARTQATRRECAANPHPPIGPDRRRPGLDAEVVIRSGGLVAVLRTRPASRGKTPRGWWGYPVDRFERAIGRQVEVLEEDR
jgi:hypothetical protein